VRFELEKKSDGAIKWAKQQKGLFVPIDDGVQREVAGVLAAHPRLVAAKRGRNAADPFVIALARLRGAVVVTQESPTAKDKVPEVCRALAVPCVNLIGLIRREGWTFPG
jgi:hypothetical protein